MRIALLWFALAGLGGGLAKGGEPLPRILLYIRNGPTIDGKKGYIHSNNLLGGIRWAMGTTKENHEHPDSGPDPT